MLLKSIFSFNYAIYFKLGNVDLYINFPEIIVSSCQNMTLPEWQRDAVQKSVKFSDIVTIAYDPQPPLAKSDPDLLPFFGRRP